MSSLAEVAKGPYMTEGRWARSTCSDVPFKGMRPLCYHFMVLQRERPSAAACLSVYLFLQFNLCFLFPQQFEVCMGFLLQKQCSGHSWSKGGGNHPMPWRNLLHGIQRACRDHVLAEWCDGLPLAPDLHCCLWWFGLERCQQNIMNLGEDAFFSAESPCQKQQLHLKGQGAREAL